MGLTNFNDEIVDKIKGLRTKEITDLLGFTDNEEVLHRDNMVVL